MSTDNETRLRTVLRRLIEPKTESGVKAALTLALWTQTQLPNYKPNSAQGGQKW